MLLRGKIINDDSSQKAYTPNFELTYSFSLIFSRCKFVQTDVTGDELVQLQIIHTLSSIIKSPVSCYLTDATAWDIIAASHSILIHIAATGKIK
jgi:hypothetical protein